MSLNDKPVCDCCPTKREYIAQHYDPDGLLEGDEDPRELAAHIRNMDDGEPCGIEAEDFEAYLAELAAKA